MEEQAIEETAERTTCSSCLTIPVSALALEVDVPLNGWATLFDDLGIRVLSDPAGRKSILTIDARRLLGMLRRRDELFVEDARRRTEKMAKKYPVPVGPSIPAQEGLSPFETLAATVGVVSPQDEFGNGRERPDFLREELLAGQRDLDEKKQLAAARAAQRLADQARVAKRENAFHVVPGDPDQPSPTFEAE